uniref:DNA-directed RNA polymerase subunit beta n=1 Tax=Astrosyne radiata TaxID=1158023 RepID=A0A2U9NT57_9STRA|nr:RNA polymerase beta subunit [Astrosyne radiata]AWT40311.1 RNA polymerase beta subunit [Astrosyne radiata]
MNKMKMNYITNFPDFLQIQRTSFCWFISKGILEVFNNFNDVICITTKSEYILFTNEYKVLLPSRSLHSIKLNASSYMVQISIPLQVRDKVNNVIYSFSTYNLFKLPLMTNSCTFYLSGCERVVINQIVRSPGVYFKKVKSLRKPTPYKQTFSTEIDQLKSFIPSGDAFLFNQELSVPYKTEFSDLQLSATDLLGLTLRPIKKLLDKELSYSPILLAGYEKTKMRNRKMNELMQELMIEQKRFKEDEKKTEEECNKERTNAYNFLINKENLKARKKYVRLYRQFIELEKMRIYNDKNNPKIRWKHPSITNYSLKHRLSINSDYAFDFNFFSLFEIYKRFVLLTNKSIKKTFLRLFIKHIIFQVPRLRQSRNFIKLLSCFNWLIKTIIKYKILIKNKLQHITIKNKIIKVKVYEKQIQQYLIFLYIELHKGILFTNSSNSILNLKKNLKYLTQDLKKSHFKKVQNYIKNTTLLRPTIRFLTDVKPQIIHYFSTSSYPYDYQKKHEKIFQFKNLYNFPSKTRKYGHRYIKTENSFSNFTEYYQINPFCETKYKNKNYYSATLIPSLGSWIRFRFQKTSTIPEYRYPTKDITEDLTIQLEKYKQKPILLFFKEMGLTHLEIYSNLKNNDFFYSTKPFINYSSSSKTILPCFDINSNKVNITSDFSHIFNPTKYNLSRVGRLQINSRLNLTISPRIHAITYNDIFAIIDELIGLTVAKFTLNKDNVDHYKNKKVRPIGELLIRLMKIGYQRVLKTRAKEDKEAEKIGDDHDIEPVKKNLHFTLIGKCIREFFSTSQLSQYLDQTNPLSSLTHRRRVSCLGPDGLDRAQVSFSVREIHPSQYGRVCPIETSEGQNVGLTASLATCARVNKSGYLETPYWRVVNGKVFKTANPIYLTADMEDFYKIAPADIITTSDNYLIKNKIPVKFRQDFTDACPSEVDFISVTPIQMISLGTSLIPFIEHNDANRALMGSNMQRQAIPLLFPQKPIVGTGLERQIAIDSGMVQTAQKDGIVKSVTGRRIIIQDNKGQKQHYRLEKYMRTNQQTCFNQRPIVWEGEKIKSGQPLTDGPGVADNELALGQNVIVSYMPWQGYNFEDAILVNERLIYENIFSSIHIARYKVFCEYDSEKEEKITKAVPYVHNSELKNLEINGVIKIGTFVKPDDILVGKVVLKTELDYAPENLLIEAIFFPPKKKKRKRNKNQSAIDIKDNSFRVPKRIFGRVISTHISHDQLNDTFVSRKVQVYVAQLKRIKVGDKMSGRHGNKGVISRILPKQDMPFLPDGTPVDILLNPLGVPSRMNVGQLYECLLGLAGDKLNCRFKVFPFDEMHYCEASRILINKKLRKASVINNESWLFHPYTPGKMVLIDGRTGKEFENPVTVGTAYMLKLIHMVDDKIHARANGPYSITTQQPLRGKASHGGQRFGEMEVWALEGFGAAITLRELLTLKSDDMEGRHDLITSIVEKQPFPDYGVPESFKVALQELRSLGIDMMAYEIRPFHENENEYGSEELDLIENELSFCKDFAITLKLEDEEMLKEELDLVELETKENKKKEIKKNTKTKVEEKEIEEKKKSKKNEDLKIDELKNKLEK